MAAGFEDIRIVAFDDKATRRGDPNLALMHLVLKLSAAAPHEWAHYFNESWRSHIYMMKRNAHVSGAQLEIYCVPEELEKKFRKDPRFKRAFEALTPGRQRGYLFHFAGAKQSATRTARIEKAMPAIFAGRGFLERR